MARHAYSNIYRWGGSNEYQQSMFLSRNKKNNVYPFKPDYFFFYCLKVGFKGVKIKQVCFRDEQFWDHGHGEFKLEVIYEYLFEYI